MKTKKISEDQRNLKTGFSESKVVTRGCQGGENGEMLVKGTNLQLQDE